MKPLNDNVIVRRDEAEKATKGGIILPDVAKREPRRCRVVAAGPGKMLEDGSRAQMQVRIGDKVLFGAYAGSEIEICGDKYVALGEEEILAVIEE